MKTIETYTTLNEIYKGQPTWEHQFGGHAWIETGGEMRDYPDEVLLGEMGGRKGKIVRKPFPIELQKEVMKIEWKRHKKTLKWNRRMNPTLPPEQVDAYFERTVFAEAGRCASRVFYIMEMCKEQKLNYKIVFGSCGVQQGKDVWWEYG